MKTTITTCDVCRKQIGNHSWEDDARRFSVLTNCTSQNPMERITKNGDFQQNCCTLDDVCWSCMKSLSETIASKIESLRQV